MDELTLRPVDAGRTVGDGLFTGLRPAPRPSPRAVEPASGVEANRLTGGAGSGVTVPRPTDLEVLEEITEDLNHYFSGRRGIRFKVSQESHEVMVQVVDRESDEVLRTIPPERLVNFRDSFREISQGILLDDLA